jgi:hypothetical protein
MRITFYIPLGLSLLVQHLRGEETMSAFLQRLVVEEGKRRGVEVVTTTAVQPIATT